VGHRVAQRRNLRILGSWGGLRQVVPEDTDMVWNRLATREEGLEKKLLTIDGIVNAHAVVI
jgi:hypothetical protein